MPRPRHPSQKRRSEAQTSHLRSIKHMGKENVQPPSRKGPETRQNAGKKEPADHAIITVNKKLANSQRQVRRLKTKVENLVEGTKDLKETVRSTKVELSQSQDAQRITRQNLSDLMSQSSHSIQLLEGAIAASKQVRKANITTISNLKKRLKRANKARERRAQESRRMKPTAFRLMAGRSYSSSSRRIARHLVASGCARAKAGSVLAMIANELGAPVARQMSRRTVSRTMLEGYIASKIQIGHEVAASKALTISGDGTSNRGVSFESRHIAMRVPNYSAGQLTVDQQSVPKIRLLGVDSVEDQSADAAVDGFTQNVNNVFDIFNRSPTSDRLQIKVSIRHFLKILKGMNSDHASKEKSAAHGMVAQKKASAIEELGEKKILEMQTVGSLAQYLAQWNHRKIVDIGGINAWNQLSPLEQAKSDRDMMHQLLKTLGEAEYLSLTPADRRSLDLFIWAGCCMHKDQNSFQGGNAAMIREWEKLGVNPPILLANKGNAAILRRLLEPGTNPSQKMTTDEERALEQSTRGGVKATALAGAIFRNKDDKKGQGDKHTYYFKTRVDETYTRFPDTSNTRFGSHGDAAADLLQYLKSHIEYLRIIRLSKTAGTLTQIEHNVLSALNDAGTLTELCAMVLYHQAVSKPYMRAVRSESGDNVLDLGPLHVLVREFVEKIVSNPELLVGDHISHVDATLDGQDWENPDAVAAVSKMRVNLPHLRDITVAFFRGTLATWERFSSEFAPGGIIDEASAEEKHLAWMPATNDVNEGALGQYRVVIRGKPSLTLHQYNAMAMFRHNETQSYMDAVFTTEDHEFIRKEARRVDASGIEKIRKQKIVDFRLKVAQMRQEKEAARSEKLKADAERLSKITVISKIDDIYDQKLTKKLLGDQIDAIRFSGLPNVPAKSRFKTKSDLQDGLKDIFVRFQEWKSGADPCTIPQASIQVDDDIVGEDWEALEDEEMEE